MSVIVVVSKNGKNVIASDTLTTQGSIKASAKYVKNSNKILEVNGSFIGLTGSAAHMLVFENLRTRHPDLLVFGDTGQNFEALRNLHEVLKAEYFTITKEDDDNQPYESNQFTALIANRSGIFEIDSYREVLELDRFWAIGSGSSLALGAMYAVYENLDDPKAIAEAGVAAACEFDRGCDLPMEVFVIGK